MQNRRGSPVMARPLKVVALLKQIPRFEDFVLGADGRLVRDRVDLEINPYCRRAIAKGIELAKLTQGSCIAVTLGPPSAERAVREALAAGADRGVHVCDHAFAGSDTLATARALAAVLKRFDPIDLVLVGLNSVDSDTGQVGPELAELLDLPFVSGARTLAIDGDRVLLGCERDDGWMEATVGLPAVISVAERICSPIKVSIEAVDAVTPQQVEHLEAAALGRGPWGMAGSPTSVGRVRTLEVPRLRRRLRGSLEEQVVEAVHILRERGALVDPTPDLEPTLAAVPELRGERPVDARRVVAVLGDPHRKRLYGELLSAAVELANHLGGEVIALSAGTAEDSVDLGQYGIDEVVHLMAVRADDEEGVAGSVTAWVQDRAPWALLGPSTAWGRHVMSRVAARLGIGLTGDAVELEVSEEQLVAWKPAFGGQLVAAVTSSSPVQMVTVRPGVLGLKRPKVGRTIPRQSYLPVSPPGRVSVLQNIYDDSVEHLATATALIGVGMGVAPEDYPRLDALLGVLDAELVGTRKVTDRGWLPRVRQIGITGRAVAPRLYIALGISGNFNHMVGVRSAGTILAVNTDPYAAVHESCDVGIVGDWRVVVHLLDEQLGEDPGDIARAGTIAEVER